MLTPPTDSPIKKAATGKFFGMALRPIRPSAGDKAALNPVRLAGFGYPGKQLILGILSLLALFTCTTKYDLLRSIYQPLTGRN